MSTENLPRVAEGTADSAPAALLDVRGVQKTYTTSQREVEAVRDLTFHIDEGGFVCMVGPSGAGKTTILKCIAGLLAPTSGSIRLAGEEYSDSPAGMAVVFQEYGRSLYPWLTVSANVELPLKAKKLPRAEREHLVRQALEVVGLGDFGDVHPWQLSGGMQQRVAIARAIAYQPKILLMDEPFAAVDAQTRADLEDLMRRLWSQLGITVLFITHDIDEAVYLGQRVIVLSKAPSVILESVDVDLPRPRNQIDTRKEPKFIELRTKLHGLIQHANSQESSTR
ncbi:ABC transporter ATP-binding protein [Microbacterium pseudoresistens]|uniref:NitT/TauT family transport system ATP-binding protein n=1 Tax=Microbacterium pseudoresistens TaxID=640634 RepID=A0A7Y9EXJ5_9MICO|nr:NitT/TauT family transport system ATP-binding protein [Microbacterium pseudoresistens]